jgi:hypothetical protein
MQIKVPEAIHSKIKDRLAGHRFLFQGKVLYEYPNLPLCAVFLLEDLDTALIMICSESRVCSFTFLEADRPASMPLITTYTHSLQKTFFLV